MKSSRRSFVAGVLGAGTLSAVSSSTVVGATSDFTEISTPTSKTINAVVMTSAGPCAVSSGGEVLFRTPSGWETAVKKGLTGASKPLTDAATTDQGRRVWVCGGSGRVGAIDVETREVFNHSQPLNISNSWSKITVSGIMGNESVALGNSNGQLVVGGPRACLSATWADRGTPYGGSVTGVAGHSRGTGYISNPNGNVWQKPSDDDAWKNIGPSSVGNQINDIDLEGYEDLLIAGNSGTVGEYQSGTWKTHTLGSNALYAAENQGDSQIVTGAAGSIYENSGSGWTDSSISSSTALRGAALGDGSSPDTVAGGGGSVYERGTYAETHRDLVITLTDEKETSYELHVKGTAKIGRGASSDQQIAECTEHSNCEVLSGTVDSTAGNSTDLFEFSGKVYDLAIPTGSISSLNITIDGYSVEPAEIAQTSWTAAESPTSNSLNSITATSNGQFAVGGSGNVVRRTSTGWTMEITSGPGSNGNNLYAVDSSTDGEVIWFGGSSGALGRYDISQQELKDYTAPQDVTSTFRSVAVLSQKDSETVILGNGSGQILTGTHDGSKMSWNNPITPGSGSSITGVSFLSDTIGYFCDSNGDIYKTTDQGSSWSQDGIKRTPGAPQGLHISASNDPVVAAGSGYYYTRKNGNWSTRYADGKTMYGVDRNVSYGVMVGKGGQIFTKSSRSWELNHTISSGILKDVVVSADDNTLATAVGTNGTIMEQEITNTL